MAKAKFTLWRVPYNGLFGWNMTQTNNFIARANLDILQGTLAGTIEFSSGLNIIGGENGTLKTKLLQQLRGGAAIPSMPGTNLRIQAISPKRNSERRAADQILQQFRQENRTWDVVLNERISAQINDAAFEKYPSLGDLYYLVFEHRTKDGGDRKQHMEAVKDDFNKVIQSVFHQYRLVADWNEVTGAPNIRIKKREGIEFPIEGLSLGEQEILGLIASIYSARDRIDVYIIDEPEVHLNWHLEIKLFEFLDKLCETEGKQAIVVTHSRAMFTPRFYSKAQFLYWEGNKVKWSRQLTDEQQRRIAGEAIEIIKLGNFGKPTFFVEDSAHRRFIETLACCFGTSVIVTECGNSSNVKSMFKLSKGEGNWQNSFFMIDGDNQGNPYPNEDCFLHLPVYCSDNFLLHPDNLSVIFGRPVGDIQQLIRNAIVEKRSQILKQNKFFDFLIDQLEPHHITFERLAMLDASEIIESIADGLGVSVGNLTETSIKHLYESGKIGSFLPRKLVDAFEKPVIGSDL